MNIQLIEVTINTRERIPFHTTFIFIKECISTFKHNEHYTKISSHTYSIRQYSSFQPSIAYIHNESSIVYKHEAFNNINMTFTRKRGTCICST